MKTISLVFIAFLVAIDWNIAAVLVLYAPPEFPLWIVYADLAGCGLLTLIGLDWMRAVWKADRNG